MKAAIYLRVSTEEQRERQSIETQRDFAQRHCDHEKISITGLYADDGVTGTLPLDQRPEGARLLADARAKKFDAVLVYKLDRLGREPRLILNAVKEFEDLGVAVKSMTEPFETSSPSGRFLLTMLSGVAGFERDTIVQRSTEGTNRLARAGVWLGGVTPYGYRVEGKRKDARLAVSEEPVPGAGHTEAGVIRLIYRLCADEGRSCIWIAGRLNALGVPPAYARDGRQILRGKRKRATAGIWRSGRVRNLLINPTYRGLHEFGKRAKRPRALIARPVPAIVDEAVWNRAQQTLRRNFMFGQRNARRRYLLRGLIKCAHCGLTYIGTSYPGPKGSQRTYYVCNGKHQGRAIFGSEAMRCRSKAIAGEIEDIVWRDVKGFLRKPKAVLAELANRLKAAALGSTRIESEVAILKAADAGKEGERNRVIGLFRRGRIDEGALDQQLDEIERERGALGEQIRQLETEGVNARDREAQLATARDLLAELNRRLDQPLTWELKRQLVEALVEQVRVETVGGGPKRDCRVTVTYRFSVPSSSIETLTPARAVGSATPSAAVAAIPPSSRTTPRG